MREDKNKLVGKILIADDEQTFLNATAQLLRNEGFICDCAEDGTKALKILSKDGYDLLIADIKMPGNSNLELIRRVCQTLPALSVILITAYPSQQTAINAIQLPITAYLIKPVEFPQLLQKTIDAIKISRLHKTIIKVKRDLQQWIDELTVLEASLQNNKKDAFDISLRSFFEVTTLKIDEAIFSICQVIGLIGSLKPDVQVCNIMQCPKLAELTEAIEQSIEHIKKSREMYKSKQLGKTREKLEKLLEKIKKV